MTEQPTSSTEREQASGNTAATCCGKGGSWAPEPGQPLALGCQLCPNSPTYWRKARQS